MRRFIIFAIVCVFGAVLSSPADAAFKVTLDDNNGHTTTISDGDADGVITFSGTFQNWSILVGLSQSKPSSGSAAFPNFEMNVNAKNVSGAVPADLTITVTDTDFGPSYNPLFGMLSLASSSSGTGTITSQLYSDLGNTEFAKTTAFLGAPISITGLQSVGGSSSLATDAAYSLTMVVNIHHATLNKSSNFTASFASVPEPGSLALMLGAFPFGGLFLRRRRRVRV